MKGMIMVGALLAASGAAFGQLSAGPSGDRTPGQSGNYTTSNRGGGSVVNFNVAGIMSMDGFGDPDNEVFDFDLAAALGLPSGTPVTMTGIGWDVNISAFGASWLADNAVMFDDNINPDGYGLYLRPGASDANPGTASFSSGGFIDLTDVGIPDIFLPNGILRLEFLEDFDDVADAADGSWNSGTLQIVAVPAPGALALLGLGGLVAGRRRR